MTCEGPEGRYTVRFQPTGDWEGIIDVSIGGHAMRWDVMDAQGKDGGIVIGGLTSGSEKLWQDQYWFELRINDSPPVIRYWGDRVIWREDRAA
jgi:hypothetical protein